MIRNVGSTDKIIRLVVGIALVAWALLGTGSYHWIGWLGVILIATALLGTCLLYIPLGIKTCPAQSNEAS